MKIKGLKKAYKVVDELETNINEKIDTIEWNGETREQQKKDYQLNEFYNAGLDIVEEIRDRLDELSELVFDEI